MPAEKLAARTLAHRLKFIRLTLASALAMTPGQNLLAQQAIAPGAAGGTGARIVSGNGPAEATVASGANAAGIPQASWQRLLSAAPPPATVRSGSGQFVLPPPGPAAAAAANMDTLSGPISKPGAQPTELLGLYTAAPNSTLLTADPVTGRQIPAAPVAPGQGKQLLDAAPRTPPGNDTLSMVGATRVGGGAAGKTDSVFFNIDGVPVLLAEPDSMVVRNGRLLTAGEAGLASANPAAALALAQAVKTAIASATQTPSFYRLTQTEQQSIVAAKIGAAVAGALRQGLGAGDIATVLTAEVKAFQLPLSLVVQAVADGTRSVASSSAGADAKARAVELVSDLAKPTDPLGRLIEFVEASSATGAIGSGPAITAAADPAQVLVAEITGEPVAPTGSTVIGEGYQPCANVIADYC